MVPGAVAVPRPVESAPIQLRPCRTRHSIAPRPPSPTAPRAGVRRWSAAMGYDKVLSLGGFKGWVDAGGEAEKG
jgi:hypothetical protein